MQWEIEIKYDEDNQRIDPRPGYLFERLWEPGYSIVYRGRCLEPQLIRQALSQWNKRRGWNLKTKVTGPRELTVWRLQKE